MNKRVKEQRGRIKGEPWIFATRKIGKGPKSRIHKISWKAIRKRQPSQYENRQRLEQALTEEETQIPSNYAKNY